MSVCVSDWLLIKEQIVAMAFSIALQTAALFIFTDYAKSIFADSDVNHASNRFVESSHTLHIASHSLRGVPGKNAF